MTYIVPPPKQSVPYGGSFGGDFFSAIGDALASYYAAKAGQPLPAASTAPPAEEGSTGVGEDELLNALLEKRRKKKNASASPGLDLNTMFGLWNQ